MTTTEKVDEKCLSTWHSKKNEINFTNEKKALIFGFDDRSSAFSNNEQRQKFDAKWKGFYKFSTKKNQVFLQTLRTF